MYLPEVGPARKQIHRPINVPPLPPGMYLPETGSPKGSEKK
jgi:hypothetical protein